MVTPDSPMILTNSIDATAHQIGDEICDTPPSDAGGAAAEKAAYHVPMTIIRSSGDTYASPDGVVHTLKAASPDPDDRYSPPNARPARRGHSHVRADSALRPPQSDRQMQRRNGQ